MVYLIPIELNLGVTFNQFSQNTCVITRFGCDFTFLCAHWVSLHAFASSADIFQTQLFRKILFEIIPSVLQI